jgi:hypothetical protein
LRLANLQVATVDRRAVMQIMGWSPSTTMRCL